MAQTLTTPPTTAQMLADPHFRLAHIRQQTAFFTREIQALMQSGQGEKAQASFMEWLGMIEYNTRGCAYIGDGQPSPV